MFAKAPTQFEVNWKGKAAMTANAFDDLREANKFRQLQYQMKTNGEDLPALFKSTEFAGEAGEVCNVVKKLERERLGWHGSRDTVEHLAEELADVIICADLLAMHYGIDLWSSVVTKFNSTSDKLGLPTRL